MAGPGSVSAALVRGKVARFTLVDACGLPKITNSMYVTEGFVQVTSAKNVDQGDEIKVRQANGYIGVYEPGLPTLLNFGVTINFVKFDIGALTMLTGDPTILDAAGANIVGWEELGLVKLTQNFALEVWTDSSGAACTAGAKLYGYMLYPFISHSYLTITDITDKEITGTINAMSFGSPSWGKGPYGDSPADGSSVPGPVNKNPTGTAAPGRLLVAASASAHRHFELTNIAPPASFTTPGPVSITLPTVY